METYTKEQLIEAQIKYNKEYAENPMKFEDLECFAIDPVGTAERTIDYLLSLVK